MVRFGVVGLKGMGGQHVREISGLDRAELVAVADLDLDYARQVGEERGARAWGDYPEMIAGRGSGCGGDCYAAPSARADGVGLFGGGVAYFCGEADCEYGFRSG